MSTGKGKGKAKAKKEVKVEGKKKKIVIQQYREVREVFPDTERPEEIDVPAVTRSSRYRSLVAREPKETTRERNARTQKEPHTEPSKASKTKTRVMGNREPQQSVRERNEANPTPEAQDESFRHIMKKKTKK